MQLDTLLWLFPVIFMIHEFEEIIFLKPWWRRNKHNPAASPFTRSAQEPLEVFVAIVAEEFLLFSAIIIASIGVSKLWIASGLVCAVGIHLVGHIMESICFRRYMPSVVSAVLTLPYYIYVAYVTLHADFSVTKLTSTTIILGAIGLANLWLMHKIGSRLGTFWSRRWW